MKIEEANVFLNISTGYISGKEVIQTKKYIDDLKGVFKNEKARARLDNKGPIYEVQAYLPVEEGKTGGLYFGNSIVYPGKVDNEYFMTRGHFHENIDTAEFYWCIQGKGMLILMDEKRNVRAEKMHPGSLHYIPGKIAHRAANTGDEKLVFNACWPSNAGHNYKEIEVNGFSARLVDINGKPSLIKE